MKTTLVFFDTARQGRYGTGRGLVATLVLLAFWGIWYGYLRRKSYAEVGIETDLPALTLFPVFVVMAVLLASAIAVQLPKTPGEAVLYGALVGAVVHGTVSGVLFITNPAFTLPKIIPEVAFGVGATASTALLVFNSKLYP